MLYKYDIDEVFQPISDIVENFINSAKSNETNINDLLLVILDAHYYPNRQYPQPLGASDYEIFNLDNLESRKTQNNYIVHYYNNHILDEKIELGNTLQNLEIMNKAESLVHYEMLLYLKIWEMDFLWTCLYQLLLLNKGKKYDWFLKIVPKGKAKTATAHYQTKDNLKDYIKQSDNEISRCINSCFNKDLRNAIAHSQFSLSNMQINLSNDAPLKSISFDDWSKNYFAKTMVFYKTIEDVLSKYVKDYQEQAQKLGGVDCFLGDNTSRKMRYDGYWFYYK